MKKILIFSLVLFFYSCTVSNKDKDISILTMGNVNERTIENVKHHVSSFYGKEVKTLEKQALPLGFTPEKYNLYNAENILNHVKINFYDTPGKILIITDVDLCIINENEIIPLLGIAGRKTCIVSTKHIKEKKMLSKASIHELGHTFGLKHCENPKCLMIGANHENFSIYNSEIWMCENCRKQI